MDDLTLAMGLKSLMGKNESAEEKAEADNPTTASIVYMVAVTNSSGGEVVLRNEEESEAEWAEGTYEELDDDGNFEDIEEDEELEDVDDTVIDLTDGDGANVEEAVETIAFTVTDYQTQATAEYLAEVEEEVEEDELAGEDASITDEIDDGDAEELPDVGEDTEDELPDEDAEIDEVDDADYELTDDNEDDESDIVEGAEISDGYTVAECIGTVKEGDRVAVAVQNGRLTVIGVVGSGDLQEALIRQANEEAREASEKASTAEQTANTAKEQAQNAINKAGNAETLAKSASENANKANAGVKDIVDDLNSVKDDAEQSLADAINSATEKKVDKMTASFASKVELESELERSAGKLKSEMSAEYASKTDLIDAKVEMQSAIEQTADKISTTVSDITDAYADLTNSEVKAQIEQAKANLETAQTELANAKTALADAEKDKILAETNLATAQGELSNAQKELADAESYYNKLVEIGASTEEIEQARADVASASNAVTTAQAKVAQAQNAITSASNAVATAQNDVDRAKANVELAENGLHTSNMTAIEQTSEEISLRIKKAGETAEAFMTYDADNGLQIGNKQNGSWSGYRSQLLPDSFNILDDKGDALAKYSANRIDLGINNSNAVISLCGEKGTIKHQQIDFYGVSANGLLFESEAIMLYSDKASGMRTVHHQASNDGTNPIMRTYIGTEIDGIARMESSFCRDYDEATGDGMWETSYFAIEYGTCWMKSTGSAYIHSNYFTELYCQNGAIRLTSDTDVELYSGSTIYSLLGLARAMSQSYTPTCTVTAGTNWTECTANAHLMGNCLRMAISAKRTSNPLMGNQTNETVMTIKLDAGGKIDTLYRVSFNNDTDGSVASFSAQASKNSDGTFTITIILTATTAYNSAATTGSATYNGYFVMPANLRLSAYV